MAKNVKTSKNPPYRPEKPIDWAKVDYLLMAGCTGTEIAANFDVYPDTLYNRVQNKYGMTFTAYSAEKRQKGESLLRVKQFEKALEKDNTMLVWLGKVRLRQREDDPDTKRSLAAIERYLQMQKLPHADNQTSKPEAEREPTASDPQD